MFNAVIMIFGRIQIAWDASKKQLEGRRVRYLVKESENYYFLNLNQPHIFVNNLNQSYSYAIGAITKKNTFYYVRLSSVLDIMLYDCRRSMFALQKELAPQKKLYPT